MKRIKYLNVGYVNMNCFLTSSFHLSFSKSRSQTICKTISEANGAAKNKLHEKWGNVKRKLSPLVRKSTSSPCTHLISNNQNIIFGVVY